VVDISIKGNDNFEYVFGGNLALKPYFPRKKSYISDILNLRGDLRKFVLKWMIVLPVSCYLLLISLLHPKFYCVLEINSY
jgi:hypothetical protein